MQLPGEIQRKALRDREDRKYSPPDRIDRDLTLLFVPAGGNVPHSEPDREQKGQAGAVDEQEADHDHGGAHQADETSLGEAHSEGEHYD